ncbi:DNA topoisomerase [Moheibacter lacus]|uniref:Topo IA-type catalytic domain-containing protein n=1 Tax=Moheibacter lacus TaxID=2745851 RepID=A0A838ZTU0_9FLAO|nr:DNA topoisomerase [Moheibacter lacus]MBA5630349.1 hypothetical protein [Moheibacter lacus]
MIAVLTENLCWAREIARVVGAKERNERFFKGNGHEITWMPGQMVDGIKKGESFLKLIREENHPNLALPFLFELDSEDVKQLEFIGSLFEKSSEILNATEPSIYGDLKFNLVYNHFSCKNKHQRIWIRTLVEDDVQKALENPIENESFCQLINPNAYPDYFILWDEARITTKESALNDNSKKESFQIQLNHRKSYIDFQSVSDNRWTDKKQLKKAITSIERNGFAEVLKITKQNISEPSPLLMNYEDLKLESRFRFGFSTSEVFDLSKRLFEKKLITYPFTRNRYYVQTRTNEISDLLYTLQLNESFKDIVFKLKNYGPNLTRRKSVNGNLLEHSGLCITMKFPEGLTIKEQCLYNLIASRFLESLLPNCEMEIHKVVLVVGQYKFQIAAKKIIEKGWRGLQGFFINEIDTPIVPLPELQKGDEVKIYNLKVVN